MSRYTFLNLLFVTVGFFALPFSAQAAKFSVDMPSKAVVGQEILAKVIIQTEGDSVNALSGEVTIPNGLTVSKIYDGGSALILWVDRPELSTTTHSILFSGLTPGGITGSRFIFSFTAVSSSTGTFPISITNLSALRNDGKGTPVKVSALASTLSIITGVSTTSALLADTVPPEVFTPVISTSPDIFDGKPFLSFVAQDKDSGIDHYEYALSFLGSPGKDGWTTIESPFVLSSHALSSKIFVKAIDKAGNERIEEIPGTSYYANIALWSIIIVILILCALYILKRFFL